MTNRIGELDHLLIESLRAAEMRQGCTNHTYYAEIIRKQILELFPQPLDDKELGETWKDTVAQERAWMPMRIKAILFGWTYGKVNILSELEAQAEITWNKSLALLQPKIEEARRQEREKIADWLTRKVYADCLLIPHSIVQAIRDGREIPDA